MEKRNGYENPARYCRHRHDKVDFLFVYGSLMRNGQHHDELEKLHLRFVCEASVPGRVVDLGKYPGLVYYPPDTGAPRVYGEVFALPRNLGQNRRVLQYLDEFEDFYPDQPERCQYLRSTVVPQSRGGKLLNLAWVYYTIAESGAKESR